MRSGEGLWVRGLSRYLARGRESLRRQSLSAVSRCRRRSSGNNRCRHAWRLKGPKVKVRDGTYMKGISLAKRALNVPKCLGLHG